jgi:hypothetical protein
LYQKGHKNKNLIFQKNLRYTRLDECPTIMKVKRNSQKSIFLEILYEKVKKFEKAKGYQTLPAIEFPKDLR